MKACLIILLAFGLLACGPTSETPRPPPNPPPDTDLCGQMCSHLEDLKCEESQPVYNSDLPGPVDVPNQTCANWCVEMQDKGVFINPRCVSLTPSCEAIEDYRQKDTESCNRVP